MSRYTAIAVGAWLAITLADAHSIGSYNVVSLALVLASGFAMTAAVMLDQYRPRPTSATVIGLALAGVVVARPVERTWFFVSGAGRAVPSLVILATGVIAAVLWWTSRRMWVLPVAASGFSIAGIAIINASRRPQIDVWYMLQGATNGLRHGANMYTQHWTGSPGITDQFPYLPMTAVLLAPFRWAFGDVRYGLLAAIVVSAFLISRLGPRTVGSGIGALMLLAPGLPFLVEASWTEPLLLLCLVGAVFATTRGESKWAIVALAAAIATKQHVWLLVPLFASWPAFGWRRAAAATGVGAALCLPWFAANPRAFWADAISYNLHLAPRWDSLDLFSFALRMGWTPPFWLVGLITIAAIVIGVRIAKSAPGVAVGCAFVLLVFNILNKQSFFNEWWLVTGLLALALATPTADWVTGATRSCPSLRSIEYART